jgi:hypothetical protein
MKTLNQIRKEIMQDAWSLVKNSDYTISTALKLTWALYKKTDEYFTGKKHIIGAEYKNMDINKIKFALLNYFNAYSVKNIDRNEKEIGDTVEYAVEVGSDDFGKSVLKTIHAYSRCSEKQAYCIARAFLAA